ncbi:helicase-exonuclease AddAB subunit AddA [Paenibacillus nuruki]|uniref:helicase-exonuclease AddAB subunit AddA n=1 Tax=Paenibacillus nuruki TaxID=1886670 RepID=UPI0028047DDA|nr:helicase-exonuclease AddAB subunit AddA [Paenibacillus nuruki]CAJ1314231.1 helicase-exonuclease AddAB subunit AddA [Paenibacillus nuruki]
MIHNNDNDNNESIDHLFADHDQPLPVRNEMPKPEQSTWTDDQWKAISLDGGNMLVAAAAGSGKTAVLVERIIRQVTDPIHPMDVDRMLVATFTKAAATEMRQRIRAALDKEVLRRPEDDHLRQQLALLSQASITTLHSFCLEIIQRYYSMIPLDPGFRIATANECDILREELLTELFEEKYTEEEERDNKQFYRLMNWFGGERSDDAALVLVERLYHFARSHPWPEYWLERTAAEFDVTDGSSLQNTSWVQNIMTDIALTLEGIQAVLHQAIDTALLPGGPVAYADSLRDDLEVIHTLQSAMTVQPWEQLYTVFQSAAFGKLKAVRKEGIDPQLQETVKQLRENAKKSLAEIKNLFFGRTPDEFAQELRETFPLMKELTELVIRFSQKYQQEKQRKGWVDFADLEHYALHILRHADSTPEHVIPSQVALEYRERFDQVMLDEYQDTNSVQEELVQLISRDTVGNRFMVGDVKQSIYRFRLAEPGLFLDKYEKYQDDWEGEGRRIDLSRNFRSRHQVVDAVNMIFRQIMNKTVAEIEYDERAELVAGATYPPGDETAYAPECWIIDRAGSGASSDYNNADDSNDSEGYGNSEVSEMESARLEAQAIAVRVREMVEPDGIPLMIYDKSVDGLRPAEYRDMVILLRSTAAWAPLILEELQREGIPAYSELNQGFFEAVEVKIILSLLAVIDNPQQDIPLASVLRSPIVGLNEDQLATIRLFGKDTSYYQAMMLAAEHMQEQPEEWSYKLLHFLEQLNQWRLAAREGELGDLIWRIYRDTGYLDWLAGLPGGLQRQHHLRILYDRARRFEVSTSSRGLFRFMRFIRRLQDTDGDLGATASVDGQENAIRIMTIHKSKGLEFPVVFLAGMSKMFNMQDLNTSFLMHKELGFGPKFVDEDTRVSYPTLPNLAIRRRTATELLAEEMRVLYVALTRPRDKLIMIGTVKDIDKKISAWSQVQNSDHLQLPDYVLAKSRTYLDWVGPALMRHRTASVFRERNEIAAGPYSACLADDPTPWSITILDSRQLQSKTEDTEQSITALREHDPKWIALQQIADGEQVQPVTDFENNHDLAVEDVDTSVNAKEVEQRLSWQYPYELSTHIAAKTTISEIKRQLVSEESPAVDGIHESLDQRVMIGRYTDQHQDQSIIDVPQVKGANPFLMSTILQRAGILLENQTDDQTSSAGPVSNRLQTDVSSQQSATLSGAIDHQADGSTLKLQRPKFMEQRGLSGAERGTAYHTVMQRVPLDQGYVDVKIVEQTKADLVQRQILRQDQADSVHANEIVAFFATSLGQQMLQATEIRRELAFSYGIPINDAGDKILSQGIVDCIFQIDNRWIIVDYKTDRVVDTHGGIEALKDRYRIQLQLYAQAIQDSLHWKVDQLWLYFFDINEAIEI